MNFACLTQAASAGVGTGRASAGVGIVVLVTGRVIGGTVPGSSASACWGAASGIISSGSGGSISTLLCLLITVPRVTSGADDLAAIKTTVADLVGGVVEEVGKLAEHLGLEIKLLLLLAPVVDGLL